MRRFVTAVMTALLTLVLLAGTALARPDFWVPDMNSPVSPKQIQSDWNTPAQDDTPDKPWLVGYPYDKVPDHPLPEEMVGGQN